MLSVYLDGDGGGSLGTLTPTFCHSVIAVYVFIVASSRRVTAVARVAQRDARPRCPDSILEVGAVFLLRGVAAQGGLGGRLAQLLS
mmetsp:Transcript_25898/g.34659  ORF Transcript_25898/g.34659 Transcript_25898/m.34659 type:complete len:86 (-) Transcript_25898:497-754(-)